MIRRRVTKRTQHEFHPEIKKCTSWDCYYWIAALTKDLFLFFIFIMVHSDMTGEVVIYKKYTGKQKHYLAIESSRTML